MKNSRKLVGGFYLVTWDEATCESVSEDYLPLNLESRYRDELYSLVGTSMHEIGCMLRQYLKIMIQDGEFENG
jgi:hypothetical protein